ncbi:MAG: AAA family ATPase [Candidatus Thorarchaeota archaeon]
MDDGILTSLGISQRFDVIYSFAEKRTPLLLLGPAGSGKSYLGMNLMRKFCSERFNGSEVIRLGELDDESLRNKDIKALYIAGSANVTRLDVLGGRTLDEGSYVRRPGILQKLIETGGIVFLDELSSLPPQFNILLMR